jgi:hypothetical protein
MFAVSIAKELEVLMGLFKIGLVHDSEYSFAKEILENKKGEV